MEVKVDSKLSSATGGTPYPPIDLNVGQQLHGFEVKKITPIDELRAVAIELLHPHSGARLLHLYADDSQKPVFNQSNYPNLR